MASFRASASSRSWSSGPPTPGAGLFKNQIDLYWGEDDPAGSSQIAMPASCPVGVWWIVPVVFAK